MNVGSDAKVLAQSQSVEFVDNSSMKVPAGLREPAAMSHGENPNLAESQQLISANFVAQDPDFAMTREKANRRKRPTTAPRSRAIIGPLVKNPTESSQR